MNSLKIIFWGDFPMDFGFLFFKVGQGKEKQEDQ